MLIVFLVLVFLLFLVAQRSEVRHFFSKCSSVRPSVCHTHESCLNGSKDRNILCTIQQDYVSGFLRPYFAGYQLEITLSE